MAGNPGPERDRAVQRGAGDLTQVQRRRGETHSGGETERETLTIRRLLWLGAVRSCCNFAAVLRH